MDQLDLVARALLNDQHAWQQIVERHRTPIFRLAYLITGDPAEAEDAAQETFVRAWRALPRFDPARPLRPWLLSIAANLARNRLRSISRRAGALERAVPRLNPDPAPMEAVAEGRHQAERLWHAVRRLHPNDQQVIYLRHFLQLSVADTADALQLAPGTVKSRLSRALERLQTLIVRDYPDLHEAFSYD